MDKGWSLDPTTWEALNTAFPNGARWRSVLLTPNDQDMVPDLPGVYAICVRPPNAGNHQLSALFDKLATPVYVGRSETNIKRRFLAHCTTKDPKLRAAKHCYGGHLHFWFAALPPDTVKTVEARLIACFGPPVNKIAGTIKGTLRPPINA